jgi:hypothetical protein
VKNLTNLFAMENYDNYKLQTPPEELDHKCLYCGEPCDSCYCDKECEKAYEQDN